jgi:hypothetical protein
MQKKVSLKIYVERELRERLLDEAIRENRSITNTVEKILMDHFNYDRETPLRPTTKRLEREEIAA